MHREHGRIQNDVLPFFIQLADFLLIYAHNLIFSFNM